MGSIKSYLNQKTIDITEFPIAKKIVEIIELVDNGKIVNSTAEQRLFRNDRNPEKSAEELSEANGWLIQTDSNELTELINSILNENPNELERLKVEKKNSLAFLWGKS